MDEQKTFVSCRGLAVTSELGTVGMRSSSGMHDGLAFPHDAEDAAEATDLSVSRLQLCRSVGHRLGKAAAKVASKHKKSRIGRTHGGKQDIGTVLDRRRLVRQIIEQRGAFITLSEVVRLLPERLRCNPCTISRDLSAMRIHHLRKGPLSSADRERLAKMQVDSSDLLPDNSTKGPCSELSLNDASLSAMANCFVSLDRLDPPSMVMASSRCVPFTLPSASVAPCVSTLARSGSPLDDLCSSDLPQVTHIKSAPLCDTPQSTESASTSASSPKVHSPFITSVLIFMPGEEVPIRLTRCNRSPLSFAEFKRLVPKRSPSAVYRYFFKTHCTDIEEAPVVYEELPFIGEDVNESDVVVPLWNGVVFARLENLE